MNRPERMVSRVSVTPQHETIAEAVDVIAYLKLKDMKRYIEEIIAVDSYDAQKEKYIIRRNSNKDLRLLS